MKPINIFALIAACLLAVAMAAEEEDVVTAEQELTEEEFGENRGLAAEGGSRGKETKARGGQEVGGCGSSNKSGAGI